MSKYSKGDKVSVTNKSSYDYENPSMRESSKSSATVTKVFDHGVRTDKGYYPNHKVNK